ncbi:DUF2207 domain-containing protein [Bacillus toyonensis]|uniref:DUF2207 domain-containing protein n=2 Tax=Bacillus toyonensis TaxID=155322 RepID=UPI0021CFA55F|nr:DUF2207 domain-containing protein [Bacillus toyonensis]MCU5582902.1 DUF2207 domain-containing protein [Bacillus toyonensis]
MAGRIKGITIEIGGNTQPLQNALKDVNKQSDALAKELKDVERLLKFDPGNVEALAQKQKLLTQQIENTTQKLDKLKAAEQQVQAQFQNGKISEEQYRAFRREIEFTEGSLNVLKNKLGNMKAEQENVASSTRQLETLFRATGKSVDDFAGALGNRLVNAIKSGTATSRQLEQAIGIIGREALGTEADIEKLKRALRSVDAGNSIQQVRNELRDLQQEAQRTEREFQELDIGLENVLGAMVAGGGIAGTIEKALDMSKLKTKIDITFDVPESSKKSVEEAVRGVTAYGVDAEASLEGVRRQWTLNKNASDEANAAIVKGAAVIANSYAGVDFTELIQETNEVAAGIGVSNDQALALMNSLLKAGFPPEQLDTVAEYGMQMHEVGFSAKEIQYIFEQGINTKTWNIDNLNDGVKEGRLNLKGFSQEVPKAMTELLEGTDVSAEKMKEWGNAVVSGGEAGSKAMSEVAQWIDGIKDKSLQDAISMEIFKTKWEDQGKNLLAVYKGVDKAQDKTKQNQDQLNESVQKMDANPAVKFQKAMQDLQVALEPMLGVVADVISKFAEWISNNPKLAATLATIATVIGVVSGAIMALAPIVMTVMSFFGIGALAAAGLVAGIPLLIAALAAIGIAIYKNWDSIKQWTIETWNSIKGYLIELWDGIVQSSSETWNSFLETMHAFFDPIGQFFSDLWTGIGEICSSTWNSIVEFFSGAWASFTEMMHSFFDPIGEFFSSFWSGIVETASSWWTSLVTTASELWGTLVQAWQDTWNTILTVLDPIISAVSTVLEAGWLLIQAGVQIAWAAICQYIIQPIQEAYNWVSTTISEMITWLGTQWEIAKAVAQVAWGLFKQYIIQPVVDTWNLVKEKFSDLVSWLNSQWETIKSYTSAAWNLVKQYVIQPVQELWNATKEKLNDLANWILGNWAKIQSYTLAAWQLVYKYVIDPVISAYNSTKEKFGEMYNSAKEKFDAIKNAAQEKFDAAKRNIIDPIKEAVGKVEEFIGKIKGFFSDLKLKIPKPEMPPMPHFNLETSTKNVLGKDIVYPSGIGVKWNAKGGIFTRPTIFGMNGGQLQGAGEAGREAVLPLNKKTLGDIGAGIVAAMPREQFAMPGEVNQLMGDMSRMMASSVSQLSGLKTVMSGVYGTMSNSKQAMTSSVSNQVFNNSFGSSGDGAIPMLGGDLVVEVPVVIEGRDVARGTYRYTTEYQEREKQRDSAF